MTVRSCDMLPVYTALHNNYPADALCVSLQYACVYSIVCLCVLACEFLPACLWLPTNDLLPCYVKALSLGPYSIMLIQRENIMSQITGQVSSMAAVLFLLEPTVLHVE